MSASKFFIYGGGRWREVDEKGRVAGWAGSRFIYLKRGKLCIANRKAVVRGLKHLAVGRPGSVKIGLPLSQAKDNFNEENVKNDNCKEICHCCNHRNVLRRDTEAEFDKLFKPLTNTIAVQCNTTKEIGIQVMPPRSQKFAENHIENVNNNSDKHTKLKSQTQETVRRLPQNYFKELVIDERDVELFRNFLEKDERNIFNVDLSKFDENNDYKMLAFYKINPLVNVERFAREESRRIVDKNVMDKNEFVHVLGLRSVKDPIIHRRMSKRKRTCEDKENLHCKVTKIRGASVKSSGRGKDMEQPETVHSQSDKMSHINRNRSGDSAVNAGDKVVLTREVGEKEVADGAREVERSVVVGSAATVSNAKKKKPKRWDRERSKTSRDYSRLEDDAIVTWILKNQKANYVNGNRLWRMMQPIHQANTGQFRSWHSLRNRYLRYILPALGSMALPQGQVTALRAAASDGEIKARKQNRRNSIFKTTHVRSAWTARPAPKPGEDETSTPRPLRSNANVLADSKPLTYSEITRRFALRHRSTPNSVELKEKDVAARERLNTDTKNAPDRQRKETRRHGRGDREEGDKEAKVENVKATDNNRESKSDVDGSSPQSDGVKNHRQIVRHSRNARNLRQSKRLDLSRSDIRSDKDANNSSVVGNITRSKTKKSLDINDTDILRLVDSEEEFRKDSRRLRKKHKEEDLKLGESKDKENNKNDMIKGNSKRKERTELENRENKDRREALKRKKQDDKSSGTNAIEKKLDQEKKDGVSNNIENKYDSTDTDSNLNRKNKENSKQENSKSTLNKSNRNKNKKRKRSDDSLLIEKSDANISTDTQTDKRKSVSKSEARNMKRIKPRRLVELRNKMQAGDTSTENSTASDVDTSRRNLNSPKQTRSNAKEDSRRELRNHTSRPKSRYNESTDDDSNLAKNADTSSEKVDRTDRRQRNKRKRIAEHNQDQKKRSRIIENTYSDSDSAFNGTESDSSGNTLNNSGKSKCRLQFEESDSHDSDLSNNLQTDRQTRLSKVMEKEMAAKSVERDVTDTSGVDKSKMADKSDKQKRSRRLFNPKLAI